MAKKRAKKQKPAEVDEDISGDTGEYGVDDTGEYETQGHKKYDDGDNSPTDPYEIPRGSQKRSKAEPMEEEEFRAIIQRVYNDGATFIDTELSWQRAEATDYYLGKEFGDEEDGRSAVVIPEGRAVITGMLPGMLAMLFAPDRVCEFIPTSPQTVAAAEQATEAVHTIFMEECDGFAQTLNVLKDGLIRRLGVYKWWWDDTSTSTNFRVNHVTEDELHVLQQEEGLKITRIEAEEDEDDNAPPPPPPAPQQPGQPPAPPPKPPKLSTVEFVVTHKDGRPRVAAIPPDEFIFSREARSMGDNTRETLFCGHRRELTTGELLDLGVHQEDIDEHGGNDTNQITQVERVARAAVQNYSNTREQQAGTANMKHIYVEGFIHVDYDGDGVAELRKVCTIGPTFYPLPYMNTPAKERPFACFTPDPEPHELLGLSIHDKTEMAGRVTSMILRSALDNLSQVVTPRLGYVEGEVSPGDLMNTAVSAPLRMKSPNAIQVLTTPFVGDAALQMIQFLQDHTERQTGQNKGVKQIDADALQSSTPEAVDKAVQSSEAQQQMIVRIFAEYTLKRVIRGIYGLIAEHQPRARMIKYRGKWTEIDPSTWPSTMGMRVNVAIGTMNTEAKIAVMKELAGVQKDTVSVYGPDNPLFPLPKISATFEKILRLSGIEDVDTYMNILPPDFKMPPPPPPPPTPEQIQAQTMAGIEKSKTFREMTIKSDELKLQEKAADQKYDLELRKMAMDFTLRRYQIDAQFKANYTEQQTELDARATETFLKMQATAHQQSMDKANLALTAQGQASDQANTAIDQTQEDSAAQAAGASGASGD